MVKLKPHSLFSQLMLAHMSVVILILLFTGAIITYFIDRHFINIREWELVEQANKTAQILKTDLAKEEPDEVHRRAETISLSLDAKIRVMDHKGETLTVIGPRQENDREEPVREENVGLRQREVEHVLQGNVITKKIYGPEMNYSLVAVPVNIDENVTSEPATDADNLGVVVLSKPLSGISETMGYFSRLFIYSAIAGLALAAVLSYALSRRITHPIRNINRTAVEMARGDFSHNLVSRGGEDEIGQLVESFNYAVQQVERTVEQQRKLEELRRNLVANVSHELRAPLSSMRGFTELILDGAISGKEQKKYLQVIMDNTLHLSRLVDDLMELSRLESGSLSLNREKVVLKGVMEWSIDSVFPEAGEKNIRIDMDIEDRELSVSGDVNRLHQMFTNLLRNAIEHTPPHEEVKMTAYSRKRSIIVEVTDKGPGIPEEEQPYIWERFYKIDRARSRDSSGAGLGLSITRQLVEMHGGHIEVYNNPEGSGSTFRIRFN